MDILISEQRHSELLKLESRVEEATSTYFVEEYAYNKYKNDDKFMLNIQNSLVVELAGELLKRNMFEFSVADRAGVMKCSLLVLRPEGNK